jgi:4-hydroxy-2-oxoheptanedioate aldolase
MANAFKQALREGQPQVGLWIALGSPYTAEICAGAGFDWLLFDGEHSPVDVPLLVSQLQAVAAYGSHPIARPPCSEPWLIKQYLDIGFQTLLIPLVRNSAHAAEIVGMTRYPPEGVRGVGAAIARAARWNRDPDYLARANDEICVILQVETREALDDVAAIAATAGVDAVFFGAADLSASLGFRGQPTHPEVVRRIEEAIAVVRASGKAAGALTANAEAARRYLDLGCTFVGVGNDVGLLVNAADNLAAQFGRRPARNHEASGPY